MKLIFYAVFMYGVVRLIKAIRDSVLKDALSKECRKIGIDKTHFNIFKGGQRRKPMQTKTRYYFKPDLPPGGVKPVPVRDMLSKNELLRIKRLLFHFPYYRVHTGWKITTRISNTSFSRGPRSTHNTEEAIFIECMTYDGVPFAMNCGRHEVLEELERVTTYYDPRVVVAKYWEGYWK